MIDSNRVINSVSPLKKRGKSYKGGTKVKRKATTGKTFAGTKRHARHGGFGESTRTSNRPGYNIATRFRIPDKKTFPSSGSSGDSSPPAPSKPYSFGPDGGINFNPVINVNNNNNPSFVNKNANANQTGTGHWKMVQDPGHWETGEDRELESYEGFWDKRIEDEDNWSDGMRTYIDRWKKKNPDQDPDLSRDGDIYKEWEKVSKKYAHTRKKSKSYKKYVPGEKRYEYVGGSGDGNKKININQ